MSTATPVTTDSAAYQLAARAKQASVQLASLSTAVKDAVLRDLAVRIEARAAEILTANEADLAAARGSGLADAKLRRLTITNAGIRQMADGLRQVADLPDPVNQVTKEYDVPSGLHIRKVRCPLGVILMIYEARPNVTVDAFALCFKSGNACILKGGREAAQSNQKLAELAAESLAGQGVSRDAVGLLTTSDREQIKELLRLEQFIDLAIPRGGEELIRFVHEHARVPTVQHFHGVCHIFVDETADLSQAARICVTAKTSGPATCNAVEAILVHERIAPQAVPLLVRAYLDAGVEVRADARALALAGPANSGGSGQGSSATGDAVTPRARLVAAKAEDFGREFLDLIVAMKVVPDLEAAIDHINRHGSHHTDAILSQNEAHQAAFLDRVHSSCTLVNASTRFNDGFQLGLGAEIGISTSKIHAFGPMGLEELTTQRYVVRGSGQSR